MRRGVDQWQQALCFCRPTCVGGHGGCCCFARRGRSLAAAAVWGLCVRSRRQLAPPTSCKQHPPCPPKPSILWTMILFLFFGGARYLSAPPDKAKRKDQLNSGAHDKPQETPPTVVDHPGRPTRQRTQRGSTTPTDGLCSGHDDGNISARWDGGVHPPNLNRYRQTPCTKTKSLDGRGVPPPDH